MGAVHSHEGHASNAKVGILPSRREVLQRELHAERRRLGHLVHKHGLPASKRGHGSSPPGTPVLMILLLSYKIRDLAHELAALESGAARSQP